MLKSRGKPPLPAALSEVTNNFQKQPLVGDKARTLANFCFANFKNIKYTCFGNANRVEKSGF
ncbi:MAG: hypothetical protein D6714_02945 [Bacteroidetes bacterium]|nr:MAG: hypothetical protein D6714_02945 [Bacteroidota bacterium]